MKAFTWAVVLGTALTAACAPAATDDEDTDETDTDVEETDTDVEETDETDAAT